MVASSIEMIVTTENDNQVNVVLNVNGTIDEATNDTADTQTYTLDANHYMPDWTLYLQQFVDDNGDDLLPAAPSRIR